MSFEELSSGRGLKGAEAAHFEDLMLKAYPNAPALGCPFDGRNTTYNQPSQFKRMAAIFTDGTYAEPWVEFLETFSSKTNAWGIMFEQPVKGASPAYGIQHGSDVIYYFPTLATAAADPRSYGQAELVTTIQDALINFANDGDPNGLTSQPLSEYHWPLYSEAGTVTALNASKITESVQPPHRSGFDVIHRFLRPGPFWRDGKREETGVTALSLQM